MGTRRFSVPVVVGLCLAVLMPSVVPADAATYRYIDPGEPPALRERVPVNVVFVGLERGAVDGGKIDPEAFEASLPSQYRPQVRSASILLEKSVPLGLRYTYDYELTFASRAYEDAFFGYLARSAKTAPLTHWQHRYNVQFGKLDIDGNAVIDAAAAERWLASHPPAGVDTKQDTVFLINWFGRKDFRFHVYAKPRDPDADVLEEQPGNPDTEYYVAWGGTAADDPEDGKGLVRRVWFYDLSAGPDFYSGNWDISTPDDQLVEARRIPVAWEYGRGAYRKRDDLTYDLADLTRYVAINLLFTSSPLYPIISTSKGMPSSIDLDMNFYDLPALEALTKGSAKVVRRSFEHLAPWIRFSSEVNTADPAYPEHLLCWSQWFDVVGPSCYLDQRYIAEANLMLFHSRNRRLFFDGDADYEAGGFLYHGTGSPMFGDCYGIAEDDRLTGAQSFVYMFDGVSCEVTGVGWTDFLTHEFGHHVGLSHPHDGYDSIDDVDYGPAGKFAFTYVGSEVNSVMAYTLVNNEFSVFDADNMGRWSIEAYVRGVNVLAKRLISTRRTSSLARADALVGTATKELAAHRYRPGAEAAKRAYDLVLAEASAAKVDLSTPVIGTNAVLGGPSTVRQPRTFNPALDRFCGARFCVPGALSEFALKGADG